MREKGYYWIRIRGDVEIGHWDPGAFGGASWAVTGYSMEYSDSELEVLSERLLPPDWDKGPPIKSET